MDSAFNAALKAKFDASYVAKEVEKSVESAKKTIEHGTQASSSSSSAHKAESTSAKDLNKAANKAGQSAKVAEEDVQSAIKAAMEYALKTTNDAPIQSAKATPDSALAAAHKAENNHSDAHPVHLDAHGDQSSALTSSGPAHLHHAEHTYEIKKAFVYGHNSPRVGNKETRFVGGSPPSGSSSDPKPELKAAHSAHHAHHDGATGDGTQEKLKTASDNHTGEYSFFLNENDRLDLLDDANADDGGEEDSDEDDHHDQPGHGGRGIPSAAPSIFQSAKTVASAVASRVATASHQQLDNARHRLSSLVDHMADNLAGHDELDDDDIDDEDEDNDSTSPTKTWSTTSGPSTSSTHHQSHTQVHPHHHVTVEDVTDSLSDVADNDAAQSISHLGTGSSKTHTDTSLHSKDHKSHIDNKYKAQKDSGGAHAYKPVLTSTHVDMDGFILVEASKTAHEHEAEHHGLSGHHHHQTPSSTSTKKHTTSTAPPPTKSNSASSQPSSTTKPTKHSVPTTGLSYSGVVQLHVNKNDHGAKLGITENRPTTTTTTTSTKSPRNSLFQSENYEQFVAMTPSGDEIASVISHGGDQIMPVTLNAPPTTAHKEHHHHHHHQHAHVLAHHPHDASVAPRRISTAEPTTTLTLEHGRGHMQGVEHTREAHGGKKAGVEHGDGAKKQQLTVDAQGNKVPESEGRRDSGYDLLM